MANRVILTEQGSDVLYHNDSRNLELHRGKGVPMVPGTCLRQARERLGLTYRDVERSSYEVANRRGRPDFIIRVSALRTLKMAA
jgi:hypothetical protein